MNENKYEDIKLVEEQQFDTSNLVSIQSPSKVVNIRGQKINVSVHPYNASNLWLFALLKLDNPVIDEFLIELEVTVFDAEDKELFNWKKGGWQK